MSSKYSALLDEKLKFSRTHHVLKAASSLSRNGRESKHIEISRLFIRLELILVSFSLSFFVSFPHFFFHWISTVVLSDLLQRLGTRASYLPPAPALFVHDKVRRFYDERLKMMQTGKGIDWAMAEVLAFSSLMCEGFHVRLSGQDSQRQAVKVTHNLSNHSFFFLLLSVAEALSQIGTVSFMINKLTKKEYIPLHHLGPSPQPTCPVPGRSLPLALSAGFFKSRRLSDNTWCLASDTAPRFDLSSAPPPITFRDRERYRVVAYKPQMGHFRVSNSNLCEDGALGFEYGYASESPEALVLWEAQFGDFANGLSAAFLLVSSSPPRLVVSVRVFHCFLRGTNHRIE